MIEPLKKLLRRNEANAFLAGWGSVIRWRPRFPVAPPESRMLLRRELAAAEPLGVTRDGQQVLLVDARRGSAALRELGRLREIAFRRAGEGTGRWRDLDAFDFHYRHVVLWHERERQIAGAYRVGEAQRIIEARGERGLYTSGLFAYGESLRALFPHAVELGRSFVQPRYQGLRALEYLWQGIGAYLRTRPDVRWLFGPVSLSAAYPEYARRMIVHFFSSHFGTSERLAHGRRPYALEVDETCAFAKLFGDTGYDDGLEILRSELASIGMPVPVLFKQYAELTEPGGTRFLDFSVDPAFGNCVDGLVLVDLERLKPAKRARYLKR
jgi:hypothetical protein